MPLLILLVAVAGVLALMVVLLPLSLVQRYRVGTSRQPARGWLAALNLVGLALSTALFIAGAAVTNVWVPDALRYALMGFGTGCLLGLVGLALTRWEPGSGTLYYTPNRWLVLAITLVVTARILYGFWRSWHAWRGALEGTAWIVASGVAGSLAAGAVVLGYYLTYWLGVRHRLTRHRARTSGGWNARGRGR